MVSGVEVSVRVPTKQGAETLLHIMMAGDDSCDRLRACRTHQALGSMNVSSMTMGHPSFGKRMAV